ncbi:hypothetical protein N9L92_05430, partial [Saprospiraceae bacterium]|nr:hypothetical protein [Saprospiraceae bacterium]
MKIKIFVILICFVSVYSCSLFDGFDEIPMYLTFSDEVSLITVPEEGANTQDVLGVSVFADGFNIGVFELPADVPVLDDNSETDLSIFGVVRNNGQSDNLLAYPFYAPIDFTRPFESGEFVPVNLDFRYRDDLNFLYLEDFEGQHTIILNIDEDEDIVIGQSTDARSDGGSLVMIELTNTVDSVIYRVNAHNSADPTTTPNGTPYDETPNAGILNGQISGNGESVTLSQISTMSFEELTTVYDGFLVVHDPLQTVNT